MRATVAWVMAMMLLISPALAVAAQKEIAPAMEAAAFKQMAAAIPLGSRVKVQTKTGRRMTATLMSVSDEAVIVKRAARMPEPAVTIPFAELARLQIDQGNGMSIGKAIGIGLASGAGAILTLFAIALSLDD
jgi:hypothetical protein